MESLMDEQHQAMSCQSLEDVIAGSKPQPDQKKLRPQPDQALKCPRCDSANTKFCYYNNYSLSQPRYFCKGCRRYWTQGGSLRNVPVGGGCRKNRRSSSSKKSQDQALSTSYNSQFLPHLPSLTYDPNDLTLAFARLQRQPTLGLDTILGNPCTPNSEISGNSGLLGAFRANFFDDPNGFHNIYSGGLSYNSGGLPFRELGGGEAAHPLSTTAPTITTATKQEPYSRLGDGDHMDVWGMHHWKLNGEGSSMAADYPEKDYWHGNGTAWHGIVNSPLV